MQQDTVLLFTRYGLGDAPQALQHSLAIKFLTLALESGQLPGKILFYTEGIKLACAGSPVIDLLQQFETNKVELVLCSTCLDFFDLKDQVVVGVVGGMGDILEALQKAAKVISM
ncbi:MAG: DsrE family protein [Chloroflexota bacterium]|jgi:sulfur relay (sulfurtransferase) complex TusBCD TusD component (DsrE family)